MFQQFKRVLAAGAVAFAVIAPLRAQTQAPAIEFHTVRGDMDYSKFSFTLGCIEESYVDIDFGYGPMEYKVGQADFDSASGSIKGTTIEGEVSPEGVVKVYIDNPLQIDYLDIEGVYADELEISGLKNLDILNVSHNYLKALDLTPFKRLAAVYLSDNPFDEKPLLFGPSHPELQIIDMENIGALDQSFTLTAFPALKVFFAFHTLDLRVCDTSNNPDLLVLSIDTTNVESIDLSNNPELVELNISQTKIKEFDLTQTPKLGALYCSHDGVVNSEPEYKLKSLDVSMLESLKILFASGNMIESLDLTNCPEVWHLSLQGNQLSGIDFSGNPDLYNVDISNNNMDFVTIPKPLPTYGEYYYYQRAMPVDRSYPVGATIDLSARLNRPNSTTTAQLFCNGEQLSNDYYTYEDGKITLLKATTDSVTLNFTNTDFLEYGLYTTSFKVKEVEDFGKDNAMVTWRLRPSTKKVMLSVGIAGATMENPKRFSVDFGDGNPVDYYTYSNYLSIVPQVNEEKKNIGAMTLYIPEGEDLTSFGLFNTEVIALDVTAAHSLTHLAVNDCALNEINLLYNSRLAYLNLDNNSLETLDLSAFDGTIEKTMLHSISANNNKISTFVNTPLKNTRNLSLANNQLTEFNWEKYSVLVNLNLANNHIPDINLQDAEALETLDISGNELAEEFYLPDYTPLKKLDISGNRFPLSNIPVDVNIAEYVYAPQKPWFMPEKAPNVNLESQKVTINGHETEFKWYAAADDRELTDQEIKANGAKFTFLKPIVGQEIYATWTNAGLPDFAGENIYRSDNVLAADVPTHVAANFTTTEAGEYEIVLRSSVPNNYVYIDWAGDGDLTQYRLDHTTYTRFPVESYKNADVKVYTYEDNDGISVFSVNGIPMSKGDFSNLTDVFSLSLYNNGLKAGTYKLPATDLTSLALPGNEVKGLDLTKYPNLTSLNLSETDITEFDGTPFKKLANCVLDGNDLTKLTLDNPVLWNMFANSCKLESVDLSKVPNMEQLFLSNNKLASIDVTKMPKLRVLDLSGNMFTLTTLPRVLSTYVTYAYYNQALYPVTVMEQSKVDLSSQLMVGSNRTTYRWFRDRNVGQVNGEIVGDELEEGKEYGADNGVFTFYDKVQGAVCVMTNVAFPGFIFLTEPVDIRGTGVESVIDGSALFSVAAGNGTIGVLGAEGKVMLYATDGRLVATVDAVDGTARFDGVASGVYVVINGNRSAKVAVK